MKNKLLLSFLFSIATIALYATPDKRLIWMGTDCNVTPYTETPCFSCPISAADREALVAFEYLLNEVALDHLLSKEEQLKKVQQFQTFAAELSPEVTPLLISLLLEETHSRITNILQNAGIDDLEVNRRLSSYENAILGVQNMTVGIARQMLFFVTELVIHRQHIYEFGVELGCPETQLLLHDLSKLSAEQFEGYARFFKGGKKEADKQAYLEAWEFHQYEEHHLERYKKEGFSPIGIPDERLRNNMRETVADLLAATKERDADSTVIDWLVKVLPEKKPHPRLLPFLEEALLKAHALYLEAEVNPGSDSIFKGLPCWNDEVEEVFRKLAISPMDETTERSL